MRVDRHEPEDRRRRRGMLRMRIAELCAGFGGLSLGLQTAGLIGELAWYAENDPDASTVMAANHPGVPNYGDITTADWSDAEPVDILSAGFPCQPMSYAGKRQGSADERHLWPTGVLPAITALRPRVFLGENVPGLLTVERGEVFRMILTDLDRLGYTIRWTTIGACKVGLCHHRHRIFILATREVGELPPELGMPITAWSSWPRDGVCTDGEVLAEPTDHCRTTGLLLPTPTARDASRGSGWGDRSGRPLSEVVALLPSPTASDGPAGAGHGTREGSLNLRTAVTLLPTPTATPYGNNQSPSAGAAVRPSLDALAQLLPAPRASDGVKGGPNQRGSSGDLALPAAVQPERWVRYAEAVWRHELISGARAPDPTITGKRGGAASIPR